MNYVTVVLKDRLSNYYAVVYDNRNNELLRVEGSLENVQDTLYFANYTSTWVVGKYTIEPPVNAKRRILKDSTGSNIVNLLPLMSWEGSGLLGQARRIARTYNSRYLIETITPRPELPSIWENIKNTFNQMFQGIPYANN